MPIAAIGEALGTRGDMSSESWFVASYSQVLPSPLCTPGHRLTLSSCTVGAFVLITGRLGDLYGRKNLFMLGWLWLGIFNIAIGFAKNHIVYDVLRALAGIGPAMLMPNAAALLGGAWPDVRSKHDQSRKMLAFCIFGAVAPAGYILGTAWGAAVIQTGLQWSWIYWTMAIVCLGFGAASWAVIPNTQGLNGRGEGKLDYLGSFVGVAGLILVFVSIK